MAILFYSCECPPNINTPKEIIPTEFSKVMIINCLVDYQNCFVVNDDFLRINDINYINPFNDKKKLISGMTNLALRNSADSTLVYNSILNLEKDSSYTLVFYGKSNRKYSMIIKDKKLIQNDKSYIRFIHSSIDAPQNVKALLMESFNLEFNILSKNYTDYFEINPSNYDIKFLNSINDSLLVDLGKVKIEKNFSYTFVLKGSSQFVDSRKLICQVIKQNI